MSSQLDPSILAAITAEARQCFLDEDAPEYLQMLAEGLQNHSQPDFNSLLRAAHSLKGGAGLASLTSLQHLAHKFEDLLVGLQQGKINEVELGLALVEKSIDEIGFVLSQARTEDDVIVNPELITALESLVGDSSEAEEESSNDEDITSSQNNILVYNSLTVDLENSFVAIEELEADTPEELIQPLLSGFADECTFLAQTLELPWLEEATAIIAQALSEIHAVEVLELTKGIINQLREQREEYLNSISNAEPLEQKSGNNDLVVNALSQDLEASCQAIADLALDTAEEVINQTLTSFADECTFLGETLDLSWLVEAVAPIETFLAELDSLEALLTVQQLIEEIRQQRDLYLETTQEQETNDLTAVTSELAASADSEIFIEEVEDTQVESSDNFFETVEEDPELSTAIFATPKKAEKEEAANKVVAKVVESKKSAPATQLRIPLARLEGMTNNIEELILSQSRIIRQQKQLNQANLRLRSLTRQFEPIREQIQILYDQLAVGSTDMSQGSASNQDDSFDSLEMDRYTDLHVSLQSFQELMLQIQETHTDIDFVDRELAEDVEQNQKNLDSLYSRVTDSRLVPFDLLAKRFIPQIRGLSQRFDKPVNLEIEGQNAPVDQILLEQLQTPLTHLLNNAFDHGIESKYERLANNKPETATILLRAKLQNNQLVITIDDDGGGIELEKIYHRAVERGICPPEKSLGDFKPEEIINWIFEPNFSTAAQVSDISGRGMGLDIVRNLIRKLRGQLQVKTTEGAGSTFTITLPVNLSLQSLLLIQLQNRLVAIPHTSVIETLLARELDFTDRTKQYVNWQDKIIPLASISKLFPCPRKPLQLTQGKVAIVLKTAFEPLVILVDTIVREEKLIIKPFDETVPVPTYLAGCTVLGTGKVIPVILPQGLEQDSIAVVSAKDGLATLSSSKASTILVAEDSVATRRMLEKLLTSVGYEVIVCRDGQEALEQVEQYQGKIDLILSDVEMPRLNGFGLLEQVRAKDAFKKTPIVMATSRTGDRHKQEAKRRGATDYLGKPIQPQELINTIVALLAQK